MCINAGLPHIKSYKHACAFPNDYPVCALLLKCDAEVGNTTSRKLNEHTNPAGYRVTLHRHVTSIDIYYTHIHANMYMYVYIYIYVCMYLCIIYIYVYFIYAVPVPIAVPVSISDICLLVCMHA